MKTPSIFTIVVLLMISFCSATHAQKLVLWHSNGSTTEIELFNQPLILFEGNKLLVTSPVINMEYNKNDIVRFTYEDIDTKVSMLETNIEQKDNQIIFRKITSADNVAVYKTDGVRVPVQLSFYGEDAILPLSQLPPGVYLFSVNGKTSKFTKK